MIKIYKLTRIVTRSLLSPQINAAGRSFKFSQNFRRFSSERKDKVENVRELIAAQDSDAFGSLSVNVAPSESELIDEGDIKEDEYIKNKPKISQKLSTKQYADMIKEHFKYQRVKEAIDILEIRMLQEDRVKPENYIYNLLIDGCARVGYSKKAFNLFNQMRQRGLKVTGATYTSLFNACANGPWAQDGLNKASRLREVMLEKGHEPNWQTYNAMIKAFGRCNDLKTAFLIADEMTEKGVLFQVETFNFLLQACASDKEFGFRHALLVWHKMLQKKLKPDIYSFNLILRCCRDTNFGDVESMEQVLQTIMLNSPKRLSENQIKLEAHSNDNLSSVTISSSDEEPTDPTPNLIIPRPHLGSLISLTEVKKPEDKLLLLGGFSGFLETMKNFDATPDLKTFTELIEVIPATTIAEKRLISQLKKHDIKCDVDFFNILMKKRSMRFDYEGAKEVLEMIARVNLRPDIVTYGVLALGCQSQEEAHLLIEEMNEKGIKMNLPILGAMLKSGCVKKNFDYILEILNIIQELKLKPNTKILDVLEIFLKSCNKFRKRDMKDTPKDFRNDLNVFKQRLNKWKDDMGLKHIELDEARKLLKEAPWEQFQSPQADGFEQVKGQKLQKMRKLKHYIRKIKVEEKESPAAT